MTATLYVDVERPVRAWLRSNLTSASGRVFLALPERCAYPALEMSLVDGGIDPSEAPVANALFQFSAWSNRRDEAADLAWALVDLLHGARTVTLDATLTLLGAQVVTGPVFRPDPDKFSRYIVDAALAVRVPQ